MLIRSLSSQLSSRMMTLSRSPRHAAIISQQCRRLHAPRDKFSNLLSILREPHLRTTLHHLELGDGSDGLIQGLQSPETLEELKQAIAQAGFLGEWERSAMLDTLLASLSPTLESIALSPLDWEYLEETKAQREARNEHVPRSGYFFCDFMGSVSANEETGPFLQSLRTVEFLPDPGSPFCDDRFYEAHDVFASLNLVRGLRSIKRVIFNAITESEELSARPPPQSANYTSIHMEHSSLDYHIPCAAIDSAKRLEELVLSVDGRGSTDGGQSLVYPDGIFKSLLSHRDSIQHLDLDFEDHVHLRELISPTGLFTSGDMDEEWALCNGDVVEPQYRPGQSPFPSKTLAEFLDGRSFNDFANLKHLGIGVHLFYHFARGIGSKKGVEHTSLAEGLPQSLETLRIYGYEKGQRTRQYGVPDLNLDLHIDKFMAEKDAKLPMLKRVEGLEECIPNGTMVGEPDEQPEMLWKRKTRG
ncbi:hypothetical protein BDW62DRAFT_174808 [Aspergillus aurantiobrunneus]